MRVLVCGDRNWSDTGLIWSVLDGIWENHTVAYLTTTLADLTIIHGAARGADSEAGRWARGSPLHPTARANDDYPCVKELAYPADWEEYGRAAGIFRNRQMLTEGKPDIVYAFHDDIVNSKGTKDMINVAWAARIPVILISHITGRIP